MPDDAGGLDPWEMGAAWAILGHVADRHAEQLTEAINRDAAAVRRSDRANEDPAAEGGPLSPKIIEPTDRAFDRPQDLDSFIGQERAKNQLKVRAESARARGIALDHMLFVAVQRGVGRSTLAHVVARSADARLVRLAPPLTAMMVEQSAAALAGGDILLIEDIDHIERSDSETWHALDRVMATNWTDRRAFGTVTVLATAVEQGAIPTTVLDRFSATFSFEPYSTLQLSLIAARLAGYHVADIDDEVMEAIGKTCRGSTRMIRAMVLAGRDLAIHLDRSPTVEELFRFLQVPPHHS